MLAALALTLCAGMGPLDRFTDCTLFHGAQEASNFGAHTGWALAIPLAGHAVDGKRGAFIAGGSWMAFTLVNEFALHGPESARERNLNLISRLLPTLAVLAWEVLK